MKRTIMRMLSFVIITMLMCSLIPFSAIAATDILIVEVFDVSAPVEGAYPDYGIYLPESYHDVAPWNNNGYENGICWKDEDGNILEPDVDRFRAGVQYSVEINLIANEYNSYIRVHDVTIDGEAVEYTLNDDQTIITLHKTFEAVDNNNIHLITCNYLFDEKEEYIFCNDGEIPMTPEYISREGLVMYNWYTEEEFINIYDFNSPVHENVELFARYVEPSEIVSIYIYADDSGFPYSIEDAIIGDYIDVQAPSHEDTGMFFTGWYADSQLTEKYDFSQPITGDVNLYARLISYDDVATIYTYMPNEYYYTDCYEVEKGSFVYIPDPDVYDMYFDGWFYDKNYEKPFDPEAPITDDISLYAKFIPYSELHQVSIYVFSDDEPLITVGVKDGDYYTPAEPGMEGCVFTGWYTDVERTTEYDYSPVTSDLNLYAKFVSEYDLCSVSLYVFSDTEPVISIGIEKGQTYTPAEPGKEGMIFEGWYTEPERINKVNLPLTITSDINLYANFIPEVDYLTGDVNGDGEITVIDATHIQRHVAKTKELVGNGLLAADVNKDGEVTIFDATEIQRYVAKIVSEF